ncbi:energy-coupling factor transporter transmembrane component T [Okibacterium endophyticum]
MSTVTTPVSPARDPYNHRYDAGARYFLYRLNPLAKLAAPVPFMVYLIFVRDVVTPLGFLALAILLVSVGARLTARRALTLYLVIPGILFLLSVSFGVWADAGTTEDQVTLVQLGDFRYSLGDWLIGVATAARFGALLGLALIAGLTTTGPDLVRSMVQQLRVPYRVGYTALAAYRFVPRFRYELGVIRAAHRVRGVAGGRGPVASVRRGIGYLVPLLAGAIRHAERVALAMDSRAFGAHETRTERHLVPWRVRDGVFVIAFWIVGLCLCVTTGMLLR